GALVEPVVAEEQIGVSQEIELGEYEARPGERVGDRGLFGRGGERLVARQPAIAEAGRHQCGQLLVEADLTGDVGRERLGPGFAYRELLARERNGVFDHRGRYGGLVEHQALEADDPLWRRELAGVLAIELLDLGAAGAAIEHAFDSSQSAEPA